ncbi:MAG: Glu/Leu/Phe/Val dehydrogenase [Elusimicrobiota bacterium]
MDMGRGCCAVLAGVLAFSGAAAEAAPVRVVVRGVPRVRVVPIAPLLPALGLSPAFGPSLGALPSLASVSPLTASGWTPQSVAAALPAAPAVLTPAQPLPAALKRGLAPVQNLLADTPVEAIRDMPAAGSAAAGRRLMDAVLGRTSRYSADAVVDPVPVFSEGEEAPRYERRMSFMLRFMRDDGSFMSVEAHRVQHLLNGKGGLRWHPKVALELVSKLAREMTRKLNVLGLHMGGAKGGIAVDPSTLSRTEKARLMRAYVRALYLREALGPGVDSPAPDVGTDAELMGIFMDEYLRQRLKDDPAMRRRYPGLSALLREVKRQPAETLVLDAFMDLARAGRAHPPDFKLLSIVTGKPVGKGGIAGRTEATGRGVMIATREAVRHYFDLGLDEISAVVQGFGNVGLWTAKALFEQGTKVKAVSDVGGMIYNPDGLDIDALQRHYEKYGTLEGFSGGTFSENRDDIFKIRTDVFVPAALEYAITAEVARGLPARMVVEGANFPTTEGGDAELAERGVIVVPDVAANVNGVGVSYLEIQMAMTSVRLGRWLEWSLDEVREKSEELFVRRFLAVIHEAEASGITLRKAAQAIARRHPRR